MVSNGPGHGYLLQQNLYFSPACWCLSQSTPAHCSAESPLCGCSCGQRPVKMFQKRQLEIMVVFLPGSNLIIFKLSLACCLFLQPSKRKGFKHIYKHTQICLTCEFCRILTWSVEIWWICPISLSVPFVLSQTTDFSLFTLKQLCCESLCLRYCSKALVVKKKKATTMTEGVRWFIPSSGSVLLNLSWNPTFHCQYWIPHL